MQENRNNENSNMLHNNASSREKNRRYLVSRGGGLAWLFWQVGGAVNAVVELGAAGSLGAYRKEVTEGEHNK